MENKDYLRITALTNLVRGRRHWNFHIKKATFRKTLILNVSYSSINQRQANFNSILEIIFRAYILLPASQMIKTLK